MFRVRRVDVVVGQRLGRLPPHAPRQVAQLLEAQQHVVEHVAGHRAHRVQPVALPLLVEQQVPQVHQVRHGVDELHRARQPHVARAQVRQPLAQLRAQVPAEHGLVPGGVAHPEVPQVGEPRQNVQVLFLVDAAAVHEHHGGERRQELHKAAPLLAPQVAHRDARQPAVRQRVPEAVGVAAQVGQHHRVVTPQGRVVHQPLQLAAARAHRVLLLRAQVAEHVDPDLGRKRRQLVHRVEPLRVSRKPGGI